MSSGCNRGGLSWPSSHPSGDSHVPPPQRHPAHPHPHHRQPAPPPAPGSRPPSGCPELALRAGRLALDEGRDHLEDFAEARSFSFEPLPLERLAEWRGESAGLVSECFEIFGDAQQALLQMARIRWPCSTPCCSVRWTARPFRRRHRRSPDRPRPRSPASGRNPASMASPMPPPRAPIWSRSRCVRCPKPRWRRRTRREDRSGAPARSRRTRAG